MPTGATRISAALSNLAVQYKNDEYIAGKFLKDLPVSKESDYYWIWGNDFRIPDTERANGALANMATMGYSTSTYNVKEHAIKDVITDRSRENTDSPLNLDRDMTENLTDIIMRRMEYEAMKLCFTTTTWSNNATLTSATSWKGHTTTASPTGNVLSATGAILEGSGKRPNTMVMGWEAFEALKENQNLWERIKYSERAIVTEQLLAALFDMQNVYIGSAVYDSAKEGDTVTKAFLWGSDCLVAYFDPQPGIKKASAALNFRVAWKGNPYRVKKWRAEEVEGDYIEVQTMCAPKAVATACAYLFKTVAL